MCIFKRMLHGCAGKTSLKLHRLIDLRCDACNFAFFGVYSVLQPYGSGQVAEWYCTNELTPLPYFGNRMIKIALVDDHQIIRDGIKKLLAEEEDITVVAEAAGVKEALQVLEKYRIDLLITDISMPNGSGFELIKAIAAQKDLKVMILSMHTEEAYVKRAIEMGVSGYLTKDTSRVELIRAIHAICAGETYFSDAVSRVMMNTMVKKARHANAFNKPSETKLTAREKEIIRYILDGLSSPEIAEKLFISHRTVENHRANIMNKLKVRNTIELVRKVLEVDFWERV